MLGTSISRHKTVGRRRRRTTRLTMRSAAVVLVAAAGLVLFAAAATALLSECTNGYVLLGDLCYKLDESQQATYGGAAGICASEGGKLAEPMNQTQNDALTGLSFYWFWIGVDDLAVEGE